MGYIKLYSKKSYVIKQLFKKNSLLIAASAYDGISGVTDMRIKDRVKLWFLGSLYPENSLQPIDSTEQFVRELNKGCPVIFTLRDVYGLILYDKKEQLGTLYIKDVFGITEDYRNYYSILELLSFYSEHVREGILFYAENN